MTSDRTLAIDSWRRMAWGERSGSLNAAKTTFSIDECHVRDSRGLFDVLDATRQQFPDLTIVCSYDTRMKCLLDGLKAQGRLTWNDAGNPHSRHARIEFPT